MRQIALYAGLSSGWWITSQHCVVAGSVVDGLDMSGMPDLASMGGMPDFANMAAAGGMASMPNFGDLKGAESSKPPPTKAIGEEELGLNDFSESENQSITSDGEQHEFQTEVSRLMDIIINSLYTRKEVFLRELISNATDALERTRYEAIQSGQTTERELQVKLETDTDKKTITISDNGVGMTKEDLINNLGIVAKSGTSNYLEKMSKASSDLNLIGQFGVGFYSAFLVADEVTVISRTEGGERHIWRSAADKRFTVVKDPRPDSGDQTPGTRIILRVKGDSVNFLKPQVIKEFATKYSQFTQYPINLRVQKKTSKPKTDEDAGPEKESEKWEWEQLNEIQEIWTRPRESITNVEYEDFYKAISKDYTKPMCWTHFSAEGEVEFKSILYVPGRAPHDMFENYFAKPHSIKFYARRVLVADVIDDILPKYLHFITGIVDSDDLPLNVSREQLQQSKMMKVITKKLVRKSLDMISNFSKGSQEERQDFQVKLDNETDPEKKKELKFVDKYGKFFEEFGKNLKLGCYEDDSNKTKIASLLRLRTSISKEMISFEQLISYLPAEPKIIYYAAGDSVATLDAAPQTQYFKDRQIPVLYLTEAMDEPCIQRLAEFGGRRFESIQKADLTLPETDEEKTHQTKLEKKFKTLTEGLGDVLKGKVMKTVVSRRLAEAPCAVVSSKYGYSAYMERVMKTQTFGDNATLRMMNSQRIMEINPRHPVMQKLLQEAEIGKLDNRKELIDALFSSAALQAGFDLEDPGVVSRMVVTAAGRELGTDGEKLKDADVSDIVLDEPSKDSDDSTEVDELSMDDENDDELAADDDDETGIKDGKTDNEESKDGEDYEPDADEEEINRQVEGIANEASEGDSESKDRDEL